MKGQQLSLWGKEDDQDFFKDKRDWSAAKHRILLKYIQSFCYTLNSEYINYVDGFAGKGTYEKGIGLENFINQSKFWSKYKSEVKDTYGSPLIALKCSQLLASEGRSKLKCFFIEDNKNRNIELKSNCQSFKGIVDYQIFEPQPFSDILDSLLSKLNNYPTLFFLDTFGVKGITLDQIKSIGQYISQSKGELFLLFHNRGVARHAGYLTSECDAKTAKTYMQNLTKLLGNNSEYTWQEQWYKLKDQPQQFERWALDYFKSQMRHECYFKGVTSFEIKEEYNDSRPQYSIVVGSNYPKKAFGYYLNEFVWEEEKSLFYKDSYQGIQSFLEQEWNQEQKRRIAEAKQKAIDFLGNNQNDWISFEDAITQMILNSNRIGRLKRTQYYEDILGELYQEGKLEIKNPGSRKRYTQKSLFRLK
mgnify:CR=1 FL=1